MFHPWGIPPCFNLHAEKFGQASASAPPNRRDSTPLPLGQGGLAPACSLSGRLAVVTRDAERLQVGPIKAGTAVLERHHVINHPRRNQAAVGLTCQAQGAFTKHRGPQRPPVPGLVEAHLSIKATPGPPVVTVRAGSVLGTKAGACQHRPAAGVTAGSWGTSGHVGG